MRVGEANWITVRVARVKGSAPRETGAWMRVFASGQDGSIGGGALEWEATRIAREMLRDGRESLERVFSLGPELGQCCGGAVTLDFTPDSMVQRPHATPLWIWGAGHVGRAIAGMIAPLGIADVTLIDTHADRLPDPMPADVTPLVAADPLRVVGLAPVAADHLILTYSHDLDLALCAALLNRGFATAGLIGSATKWTRFQRRLHAMGHEAAQISRIACPIGNPALGKHPQAIAIGVASAFLAARTPLRKALAG